MVDFAQQTVTQFNKGLITESSEMTFPEGASVTELNCDLFPDGSRRRRLGIERESGETLSTRTVNSSLVVSTHVWENVAEQADTNWVVVQMGQYITFYNPGGTGALSANQVQDSGGNYELDLSAYDRPVGNGASFAPISVTSVKGALVVASPEINTIYIVYDPDTQNFTVTEIMFRVRDYAWQGDITAYNDRIATGSITDDRIYDTKNVGWSDGPNGVGNSALNSYVGSGYYPPLTHPWYSAKNSSNNFDLSEFNKLYYGSSLIVNGHYILDLYSRDRQTISGVATVTNTTEQARFSTVETYAGRVWYAGMSDSTDDNATKIYFSQVLEDGFTRIGECLQRNDPTAEAFNDLLDTDGGFVSIPGMHNLKKLHTFGADLYIFAENGIWRIAGVDDVFRATEYSVQKIGEDGIVDVGTFVSASGRPYWWSNNGIHTLGVTEGGGVGVQNLSISTIQSYWEDISADKRALARGIYDKLRRRVVWMYPSVGEVNENKRNELLLLDETLGAFIPWTISDQAANTDYLVDAVFNPGIATTDVTYNVVDSSGNQVVDSSNDPIVVVRQGSALSSSSVTFLVVDGATGSFVFAKATATDFVDWGDADYSSYAETQHNFLGDAAQRKETPYITTYMKTTETGWEASGDGYVTVRPSSCKVSAYWDFKSTPSFAPQEIYRLKYPQLVDISDLLTYDYPTSLVTTKMKMRGRGRAMRLRFESTSGKDFHLIGFDVLARRPGKF